MLYECWANNGDLAPGLTSNCRQQLLQQIHVDVYRVSLRTLRP